MISVTLEKLSAMFPGSSIGTTALLEPGRAYTAREAAAAGISLSDLLWVLYELARTDSDLARLELHLAADYAEHVLHVYEAAHPGDSRPRDAIQAARDYADGKIGAGALRKARAAAKAADADAAAAAAAAAAASVAVNTVVLDAAAAAPAAVYAASATYAYADFAAEREWQLNRLLERLEEAE